LSVAGAAAAAAAGAAAATALFPLVFDAIFAKVSGAQFFGFLEVQGLGTLAISEARSGAAPCVFVLCFIMPAPRARITGGALVWRRGCRCSY